VVDKLHLRIKSIRESKNLSRDFVADRLGISSRSYSRIESGAVELSVQRLLRLSEIFDVVPTFILNPNIESDRFESTLKKFREEYRNEIREQVKEQTEILKKIHLLFEHLHSQTENAFLQNASGKQYKSGYIAKKQNEWIIPEENS
jgi:transcriptional regulator with XRE-family HTH domain